MECSPSSPVGPHDEEGWTIGDLVEVDTEGRIGDMCRLRDLLEPCRIKRRKAPGSASEAVSLAVKLVVVAAAATLPGVGSSSQPHI